MANQKCKNCGTVEDIEVTDVSVTEDGDTYTLKTSTDGCSECGFFHWDDVE
jgi:uncharacterized Zn finger protein